MTVRSYKDLIVWQKSIQLVTEIFLITEKFPKNEMYGIISQMRRASIAIPSNIAEGFGRRTTKEYKQFVSIAYGSALELETQLIISKNLKFVDNLQNIENLLQEVIRMLNVLLSKLNAKIPH